VQGIYHSIKLLVVEQVETAGEGYDVKRRGGVKGREIVCVSSCEYRGRDGQRLKILLNLYIYIISQFCLLGLYFA